VQIDHRFLQDVGSGALDRHIHRLTLGLAAHLKVPARQIRHQPTPAEHRADDARLARLFQRAVDEGAHARKAREVGVDELLGGFLGHVDVLGERERRLPVEDGVVHHLRPAAHLMPAEPMVGAKESCRCSIVDVFTGEKGLDECLLVGKMREHTQLDLRVIG
jgi:hypothetical protein